MRRSDHPRSRGVYPGSIRVVLLPLWIIPARAGFTLSMITGVAPAGDHPRSRGVYFPGRQGSGWPSGSSPLARGLRHRPLTALGIGRIIPARAGFT